MKINELKLTATNRKFRIVQTEGKRTVNRKLDFYNVMQDKLFESDFDKMLKLIEISKKQHENEESK